MLKIFAVVFTVCISTIAVNAESSDTDNSLRFSVSRLEGIPDMDPHISFGDLAMHSLGHIYEGLTMNNPETGLIEPALATRWEWVTPVILEVQLRKGVTFHNGEPFDAQAVKFSFDKIYYPEKGGFESSIYPQFAPQFQRVEVLGSHLVRLHFSAHNNTFINTLFLFKILPPRYIQKHGIMTLRKRPVGTGPFIVTKLAYNRNGFVETLYLARNDTYWEPDLPKLDKVVYHYGFSSEKGVEMLMAGKLDVVANVEPRMFLNLKKHNFIIQKKQVGALVWCIFNRLNLKQSPVKSLKVRQAIMHALNYDKMLKNIVRGKGRQINQWAFPENIGFDDTLPKYTYDPDKAKKLLAEAGFPNGFKLHIVVEDTAKYIIRAIKSDLQKIGVEISFEIVDEETIIQIGLSKNNPHSEYRHYLKSMDLMIGDSHEYDFFHNLAVNIWTFRSDSVLNFSSDPDPVADMLWTQTMQTFGEEPSERMWRKVVRYEHERIGIGAVIEKYKFFVSRPGFVWKVHSLWNLRNASYD